MGCRFSHDFFVNLQTVCRSNRKAINAIESASLIILQQKVSRIRRVEIQVSLKETETSLRPITTNCR